MQICQTRERLGPQDALGSSPLVDSSIVTGVCVCVSVCPCVCVWKRANLSSSQYVFMLMKVSWTKISVAPHEYGNSETRSLRSSSLSEHLHTTITRFLLFFFHSDLASNNKRTHKNLTLKRCDVKGWQTKRKEGILHKICSDKKTLRLSFFNSPNFFPTAEAHP